LAHILSQQLKEEHVSIGCEVKYPNGSTLNNFSGLMYGHIDAYVEYTGTACQILNIDPRSYNQEELPKELNNRSQPHGICWLDRLGVHDNYFVIMLKEVAERRGVDTISQLASHASELVFATNAEFFGRPDGFTGLCDWYGLRFRSADNRGADGYTLLENGEADVCIGWESDIESKRLDRFTLLKDDKAFFPQYDAIPAVRIEVLEKQPEVKLAWNKLGDKIKTDYIRDTCELIYHRGDRKEDYERAAGEFYLEPYP
jgi:glycine betaine/choline ABC-type transport system substrate-binding protein